jgi:hypothetical protein
MSKEAPWEEMGITTQELFTAKAIEYWKQEPLDQFLFAITHEVGQRGSLIKSFLNLLADYADLEAIKLPDNRDAKWIYDVLLKIGIELDELSGLLVRYSKFVEDNA